MKTSSKVRLDLNSPVFQRALFRLEKREQNAILNTFRKISEMTWEEIYRDPGLKWEAMLSIKGSKGQRLYSFRISKRHRGIAFREENWFRVLSLHPDHDSIYNKK